MVWKENLIIKYLDSYCTVQFHSVTVSCPTLSDPMDCSVPGSLSITNSWILLKLMSVESAMLLYTAI